MLTRSNYTINAAIQCWMSQGFLFIFTLKPRKQSDRRMPLKYRDFMASETLSRHSLMSNADWSVQRRVCIEIVTCNTE